jgi:hypothetical protein
MKPHDVFVRFSTHTSLETKPGALASAQPYEGTHIEVFYDRIAEDVEMRGRPSLLGHVLAHELTHLLQGVSQHSSSGLMKANWNDRDFQEMYWKPLALSATDLTLIRAGMARRELRIRAAARP